MQKTIFVKRWIQYTHIRCKITTETVHDFRVLILEIDQYSNQTQYFAVYVYERLMNYEKLVIEW